MFKSQAQKINDRLYKAVERQDIEKFKSLLEVGAGLSDKPRAEYFATQLNRVSNHNFTEGLRHLLQNGVDVSAVPTGWQSPLHYFTDRNNLAAVKLMLEAGAPIEAKRSDNRTPLHIAAKNGHGDIIRALMVHGADIDARDNHMNTPADLAEKDYPRIADMIRGTLNNSKLLEPVAEDWNMTGPEEIARVSVKAAIGYRITEIFNFSAGIYTQIARNLETNAESQSLQVLYALDEAAVEAARTALAGLGGQTGDITKKRLRAPAPE